MQPFNGMIDKITNLFKPKDDVKEFLENEEKMEFQDMVRKLNYPLESHNVETEDGYVLKIFRIPGRKLEEEESYSKRVRQPVLFQHGLLDSSDGWICNSEEKCPPYILANLGFDVWMSNSRGNKHSKMHKKHSPTSYEFWAFSFHEMGIYDTPAILDYITMINTSRKKVIYIGHSQGTCMMFSGLTQKLDYYKTKIKLFIALAPVARVGGMKSGLLKLLESVGFNKFSKSSCQYEVFPNDKQNNVFNAWLNKNLPSISHAVLDLVSDANSKEVNNKDRIGIFLSHYPSGASAKSMHHFIQNWKLKKFCHYDYKEEANMVIYKQKEPPIYDLSIIKDIPIVLLSGIEDKLAAIDDVRWLRDELGTNIVFYEEYQKMGHITFLMGKDIKWFTDALEIILKYSNEMLELPD